MLALQCATADPGDDDYVACRVEIEGRCRIAQLSVEDARFHADIKALGQMLRQRSAEHTECAWPVKQLIAPLFLPGVSREELLACAEHSELVASVLESARAISSFWASASSTIAPAAGELFFELEGTGAYRLHPVCPEVDPWLRRPIGSRNGKTARVDDGRPRRPLRNRARRPITGRRAFLSV